MSSKTKANDQLRLVCRSVFSPPDCYIPNKYSIVVHLAIRQKNDSGCALHRRGCHKTMPAPPEPEQVATWVKQVGGEWDVLVAQIDRSVSGQFLTLWCHVR